jgi:hypothetical protein
MVTNIPLTNDPNQTFTTTIAGNSSNLTLGFTLSYNTLAQYWVMGIFDPNTGNSIIQGIPLLPEQNFLGQYQYLGIGEIAVLINIGDPTILVPDDTNLAANFALVWNYEG